MDHPDGARLHLKVRQIPHIHTLDHPVHILLKRAVHMTKLRLASIALAALPLFTAGAACTASTQEEDSDSDVVQPIDFYSSSAKEYFISGTSTVTIEPTLASATATAKLARAKQLIALKNVAVSWF